ncbi:hypothetical protein ACPCTO_25875 [Streptomyces olivoreticuli]
MAIIGLLLLGPAYLLMIMNMAGMQMNGVYCSEPGCADSMMTAIGWAWRVMPASGVTGIVAALLPRRLADFRFPLACLQLLLMAVPFIIIEHA